MGSDNPTRNSSPPSSESTRVRVEGDVSGQVAVGESIVQIGDVHGGEVTIGQRITNFLVGSTEQQRAQRNRRAMLELVRNTWVEGVFEQSLHGAVLIELGLEEQPDAVERPWDMLVQMPGQPSCTLPRGTKVIDVFDEMNQALLILGQPGSGKTTMLLELARDTIARAEEAPAECTPVVFNLSSWAEKRLPLVEWLVEELNTKYNIPKKIAQPWVEGDELLLLLDGLDEVAEEWREDCIEAITTSARSTCYPWWYAAASRSTRR